MAAATDTRTVTHAAPATLDWAQLERLAAWLQATIGVEHVRIVQAALLAGGAVQQNWRLDVEVAGAQRAGTHAWVLRTDAAASLDVSLDRVAEFRCIEAAHKAAMPEWPALRPKSGTGMVMIMCWSMMMSSAAFFRCRPS